MRDPDKYRTTEVNRDLWRVFKGDDLVGRVRRDIDGVWYAEVGNGDRFRGAAVQRVVIANEALGDMFRVVNG